MKTISLLVAGLLLTAGWSVRAAEMVESSTDDTSPAMEVNEDASHLNDGGASNHDRDDGQAIDSKDGQTKDHDSGQAGDHDDGMANGQHGHDDGHEGGGHSGGHGSGGHDGGGHDD